MLVKLEASFGSTYFSRTLCPYKGAIRHDLLGYLHDRTLCKSAFPAK